MNFIERARFFGLQPVSGLILVILSLLSTVTEVFGVGIFLPIFQYISADGDISSLVADSRLWIYLVDAYEYVGLTVGFVLLLSTALLLFMLRQLFTFIRLLYLAKLRQDLQLSVSVQIMGNYLAADSAYHDKVTSGDLFNAVIKELPIAVNAVITPFELLVLCITMVGYLIVLMIISANMTLASLVVLMLASFISMRWVKKSLGIGVDLVTANSHVSKYLQQRIKYPRLIRLSGTKELELGNFLHLLERQKHKSIITARLQAITEVMMEPIVIAASLVFLFFSYEVFHMKVEIIGLYLIVILRLMPLAKAGIIRLQKIKSYTGAYIKIYDYVINMMSSKECDDGNINDIDFLGDIEFKRVSYSYSGSKDNALSDLSFAIKKNSLTAIVGPSGGGKSTLIDLLVRIRQPGSGNITIGENNINSIALKILRSRISYVPQSPQVFDGSIVDHIKYGNCDATMEEVEDAARLSGASDFIDKLELKYNTVLDEEASNISGGQKQRLDLARVLLKHGAVLIFDEPTSNLDKVSSVKFKESIFRIHNEQPVTIILVTHDVLLASEASAIIVLEDGRISSIGSHEALLKESAWYCSAYKKHIKG